MTGEDEGRREGTFAEAGMGLERRVYQALTAHEGTHRTAKAVALLLKMLHAQGIVTTAQVDELVVRCLAEPPG